MYHKNPEFLRV